MLIRPAQPEDADSVVQVIQACYREFGFSWDWDGYHSDLRDFAEFYFQNGNGYWVVESEGGDILGGGGLEVHASPRPSGDSLVEQDGLLWVAGADCELIRMYLLPEARGTGAAEPLFHRIRQAAVGQGCRRMEIWSDVLLTRAHRFYARLGAVPVGERICNDPDQAREYGFRLDLAP
ncbi:MAG: GNAT family N-acetyltransferase [Fimbriimonadaceae bacterium]|nr:GNAT family N-acetyltransferase [Fimbriimonadaceae bacterium]